MRKNSRTFCAFLDFRKAFDVAWRDGALLKLYRAGIPIHLWHLVDDLVSDRTAAVRIGSCASDSWDVESGVGQGAVLSGFLFNLLINGLAAVIKRACGGVSCGPDRGAPRLQVLLYADDIVILSDSPADLQRGFDAARDWANAWRFHFSIGPNKSAFVVFGRRRAGTQHVRFHVGEHVLPRVTTYTYLGITLRERLGWTQHIDELLCRGERKLAACVSWTVSHFATFLRGAHFPFLRATVCLFRVGVCTERCSNSPVSSSLNKMGSTVAYYYFFFRRTFFRPVRLCVGRASCQRPATGLLRRLRQELSERQLGAFAGVAGPNRQLQQALRVRAQGSERCECGPAALALLAAWQPSCCCPGPTWLA